ncbi:MAG: hypothetical protein AAGG56_01005 [Pseudomonadota bacterium]
MPETREPKFEAVPPIFAVADIARSKAYDVERLGFEIQFEWADKPDRAPHRS